VARFNIACLHFLDASCIRYASAMPLSVTVGLDDRFRYAGTGLFPSVTRHRNYLHRDVNIPAKNLHSPAASRFPAAVFAFPLLDLPFGTGFA
jgi:hypothetical protein